MGIPRGYQKAIDDSIAPKGSILKIIEMYQKDSPTTVAKVIDGYTKTKTNEVKRFFIDNEPPLLINLTVSIDFDDIDVTINGGGVLVGTNTSVEIDKGDGNFVEYFEQSRITFTPLGVNIVIRSSSDIYKIVISDNIPKGGG